MPIGKRLKEVRGRLSQKEIAEKLNVYWNTYARYERGERIPNLDFLIRLHKVFNNINLHWLITGEGNMYIRKLSFNDLGEKVPQEPNILMEFIKNILFVMESVLEDEGLYLEPEKKSYLMSLLSMELPPEGYEDDVLREKIIRFAKALGAKKQDK